MRLFAVFLCILLLCGCTAGTTQTQTTTAESSAATESAPAETLPVQTTPADPIAQLMEELSLEELVGQLFLARCDPETALADAAQYHLGGFVLFADFFEDQAPDTVVQILSAYQSAADLPLLIAVDEEGGTVTRISRYAAFRDEVFPSPREAYAQGGFSQALAVEEEKCALLATLSINVNLGPVCDISTDSSAFMYQRSLGQDAQTTADFVSQTVSVMASYGIGSVLKHFPGYGNNADTHTGIAVDQRSLEELESCDLIPFAAGIEAGCGAVMVSHTIVTALDSELPASLSPAVHTYLREEMGYTGVIVTDDLVMEAITDAYGAGEAAVMAVQAGNDLLCSTDYATQYNAVLEAVLDGRIDYFTLYDAAYRVLQWKQDLGLL